MKVYSTNSALGYQQLAYLVLLPNGQYLCIAIEGNEGDSYFHYEVGESYTMESYDLEWDKDYLIEDSPIFGALACFETFARNTALLCRGLDKESLGSESLALLNTVKSDLLSYGGS